MSNPTRRDLIKLAIIAPVVGLPARIEPEPEPKPESRAVIPFGSPLPVLTATVYMDVKPNLIITAIYREFAPGDSSRCRRCSHCTATNDRCHLMLNWYVSEQDAPNLDCTHVVVENCEPLPPKGGKR